MSKNLISFWNSCIEVRSKVDFQSLVGHKVITSSDGTEVRFGRLLTSNKTVRPSYCLYNEEADIELVTSDRRVALLLGILCQSREYMADLVECAGEGTNTLLEPIERDGRLTFKCHQISDGLESFYWDHYGYTEIDEEEGIQVSNPYRELVMSKPMTFVMVTTHPSLYIDFARTADYMAKGLSYFLNDAYVYQVVEKDVASRWKLGSLADIYQLAGRDYREDFYPHIMNACAFMSEGAMFA